MTVAVSEDWEDVVETLRSDLETVSEGDPEDEEVRSAIDEVWAIVDAADDRVGSVDAEEIGDVLGVGGNGNADAIDVGSIPREFVTDDPQRAAGLSRLVSLINVDESTSYDVGRLWHDEEGAPAESDERSSSGEDDPESQSTEDTPSDRSTDDTGEELRSQLGTALSQLRDKVQDTREGLTASTERVGDDDDSEEEGGVDDSDVESSHDGTSTKRRSATSDRSSTTHSTLPSVRYDMGGVTHFSTMPGRQGRSRTSKQSAPSGERDDRSGSDGDE